MPYTPHTESEIRQMLATIGLKETSDLFRSIPQELHNKTPLAIPNALPEIDLVRHLKELAAKNSVVGKTSFVGGGLYRHFSPAAVLEVACRSEFLTPYTPYQPEISQGTLAVAFEYQSMICRIFGMEISNASLYDGSTAVAEAALMALRVKRTRKTLLVCETVHPEYREVLSAILKQHGTTCHTLPAKDGCFNRAALKDLMNEDVAGVIVQSPNFFGIVEDLRDIVELTHRGGGLVIDVVTEPVSLGLITPPGEWGADIVVGEGTSFGLPLNFGGPALGIFTCRQEYVRSMPGRVCGETVDEDGKRSYVLTLSTREQHIRREKATSNICTNQAHCATIATIWLAMLGKEGFAELARVNAQKTHYARERFASLPGVRLQFSGATFNEFVLELPKKTNGVLKELQKENIFGGVDLGTWYPEMKNSLLIHVSELHARSEIDHYVDTLKRHI